MKETHYRMSYRRCPGFCRAFKDEMVSRVAGNYVDTAGVDFYGIAKAGGCKRRTLT